MAFVAALVFDGQLQGKEVESLISQIEENLHAELEFEAVTNSHPTST
jgi:hypothetical protein